MIQAGADIIRAGFECLCSMYVLRKRICAYKGAYEEWWQVEYDNMGWCRDGVTRWYWFEAEDGTPCYTLKY